MRRLLVLLAALALAACQGKDRPPARRPPADGGFAVTGRGAGARPGVLAGAPIDAAVDAATGLLAVPECGGMLRVIDHCLPHLEPALRDSMVKMREQLVQAWKSLPELPPASLEQVRQVCKQSQDSMRRSFLQMGCKDPPP